MLSKLESILLREMLKREARRAAKEERKSQKIAKKSFDDWWDAKQEDFFWAMEDDWGDQ